ncbi:hypothetical protein [Mammaliicoccus sciuri]|uniref:hypothetical protein n=1 Tax=Mammaliicoccus sciuri TaxID=1296 RepID=UPI000CD27972|nr:hypothetical protein [Mammaliicoccus sciuri]MEB7065881.1 hypothetical protein [Mammaliicoccus sciuri]PNZ26582.1 hypothetical protein CD114_07590 [Mammaliicoccus sciuri]UXU68205.1 hypothetical protein MUA36_09720 [Mammaliicoccus sciuri]
MDFDNKYYEILDISDDLLYLSQIVANVRIVDDKNLTFVIVTLNTITKKWRSINEKAHLNWWVIYMDDF